MCPTRFSHKTPKGKLFHLTENSKMLPRFSLTVLSLSVFLALLILEPCQTQADVVAYGTRLSSVGKPSSTSSAASAATAAVPKTSHVDKLQVSSSQPVPLKRSPSHYEVDLSNSESDGGDGGDKGNGGDGDEGIVRKDDDENLDSISNNSDGNNNNEGDITSSILEKELLNEIIGALPIEKEEEEVDVAALLGGGNISSQYSKATGNGNPSPQSNTSFSSSSQELLPPSESVDSAHYIHPLSSSSSSSSSLSSSSSSLSSSSSSSSYQPVHHSALFQAEPIRLQLAAEQHPGNLDGRRHPFMVDSSNVQTYVHHLPPLTAALPMGLFGGDHHQPHHLYNHPRVGTHNSLEHLTLLPKPEVHLAALEQPASPGASDRLIRVDQSGGGTTSLSEDNARAVAAAALNLHITRFAPAYVPGIPGRAWKDYPLFAAVPKTSFSCAHTSYGYYADVESGCQAWYYCQPDGRQDAFLCPNGTVFNQKVRVCDWWYNVHCPSSVRLYSVNEDLYKPSSPSISSSSASLASASSSRPQPLSLSRPPHQPNIRLAGVHHPHHHHPRAFITTTRLVTPPNLRYRPEYEVDGGNSRHEPEINK